MKKFKMFLMVLALACLCNAYQEKGKGFSHISVEKPHGEKYHFEIEHRYDGSKVGKGHLDDFVGSAGHSGHVDGPDSDHKSGRDGREHDDHKSSQDDEEDPFFDHSVLGYGDFVDLPHDNDNYAYEGFGFNDDKYKAYGHADDKISNPFGLGKYAYLYGQYGTVNGLDGDKGKGIDHTYGYKYGSYDVKEGKGKKKPKHYGIRGSGNGGYGYDGSDHSGYGDGYFSGFGGVSSGHGGFGLGGYGGKKYGNDGYGHGYGHGGYGYPGHGHRGRGHGGYGGYGHGGHCYGGCEHSDYGSVGHGHDGYKPTYDHDVYGSGYGHGGYGHGTYGYQLFGKQGSDDDDGLKGYDSHGLGDGHVYGYSHITFSHPSASHSNKPGPKHAGVSHNNKGGHSYKYKDVKSHGFSNHGHGYGGDDHGYSNDREAQGFSTHSPKGYKYKYSKVYKGKPTNSWSYNYGEYKESSSSPGTGLGTPYGDEHNGDSGKHH